MSNKLLIILALAVIVLSAGYIGYTTFIKSGEDQPVGRSVVTESDSGCCMDPPCQECYQRLGYCDCQARVDRGEEMCGECIQADHCDQKAGVCEINL